VMSIGDELGTIADTQHGVDALVGDDECNEADADCALNALQFQRSQHSGGNNRTTILECNVESCPTGEQCVRKADGTWAQCVSTDYEQYQQDCKHFAVNFRLEAIKSTGMTCMTSRCFGPEWCLGDLLCVEQSDRGWAQCISCDGFRFQEDCQFWGESMQRAGERACGLQCNGRLS